MGRKRYAKQWVYENGKRITTKQKFYQQVDAIIPWGYWKEAVIYHDGLGLFPHDEIETLLRLSFLNALYRVDYDDLLYIVEDYIPVRWFMRLENIKSLPDEARLKGFLSFMCDTGLAEGFYSDVIARAEDANLELRDTVWLPPKIEEQRED